MAQQHGNRPADDVKRLYEDAETRAAAALEGTVKQGSFGEVLARVTENVVGLTKIGTDVFDLLLRNLRLAGRQDVTRLARQLARTEDKLELVLQELERLHDQLVGERPPAGTGRTASGRRSAKSSTNGTTRSPRGAGRSPRKPRQG